MSLIQPVCKKKKFSGATIRTRREIQCLRMRDFHFTKQSLRKVQQILMEFVDTLTNGS